MTQQYIIPSYVFNKTAKTIKMPTEPDLMLEGIQLITNLTTGTLIYQFNNAALGGTVSGDTLTLDYDTSAMNDTDALQILYNPPRGGFFSRAMALLYQAVEYLRAPGWVVPLASGQTARVVTDSTSNISTVSVVTQVNTAVNLSNLGNIDARLAVWELWDIQYNTGIRSKIT